MRGARVHAAGKMPPEGSQRKGGGALLTMLGWAYVVRCRHLVRGICHLETCRKGRGGGPCQTMLGWASVQAARDRTYTRRSSSWGVQRGKHFGGGFISFGSCWRICYSCSVVSKMRKWVHHDSEPSLGFQAMAGLMETDWWFISCLYTCSIKSTCLTILSRVPILLHHLHSVWHCGV